MRFSCGMRSLVAILGVLIVACSGSGVKPGGFFAKSSGYELRPYRDVTLKNGLKVILIEDRTLPYLSMSMMVKAGAAQDPDGQSGLANSVAQMLDKGTRKRSAVQIADDLAQYGADFSAGAADDNTTLAISGLSFYQSRLITDLAEMVTEASFRDDEVERYRKRTIAQIHQLADEPEALTELAMDEYLYPGHPYSHPVHGKLKDFSGTSAKVLKKNISKFYLQYYRPSSAILAVVGQFSSDILNDLESALGNWTDRPPMPAAVVPFPENRGLKVQILDRTDLQQAQIRLGHRGIQRNNPDFVALRAANAILGYGFTSRLMREIRVRLGLTYHIGSMFEAKLSEGPFVITTFTRLDKVGETLTETLKVVRAFVDQGPTEAELADAKSFLRGQFPRSLETPEALASNLLTLRFYGVPDTYLTSYLGDLDRLTLSDMNRVIKKYFAPEDFKILIHAPKEKVMDQVKSLGPVTVRSYKEFLH